MSEPVVIALITGVIGPIVTGVLVAIVAHLLKQRESERAMTRQTVNRLQARSVFWRARATRAERAERGTNQRRRIAGRARRRSR